MQKPSPLLPTPSHTCAKVVAFFFVVVVVVFKNFIY